MSTAEMVASFLTKHSITIDEGELCWKHRLAKFCCIDCESCLDYF